MPVWNKGQIVGQKLPLKPREVWSIERSGGIRAKLEVAGNLRELALFNLAIDSKLRACDLICMATKRPRRVWSRLSPAQLAMD